MSAHRNNILQAERQAVRPLSPAARVRALLRFPFTPWIREATIGSLLADPATRGLTIEHLRLDSAFPVPPSAFEL